MQKGHPLQSPKGDSFPLEGEAFLAVETKQGWHLGVDENQLLGYNGKVGKTLTG